MAPVRVERALAEFLAAQECGWSRSDGELVEIAAGFGNHNWRVPRSTGDLLLKIGPASSANKWAAAQNGLDRARDAGLAVPTVFSTQVIGEHVVRALSWIEGKPSHTVSGDVAAQVKLGEGLGGALAQLHAVELDGFASRLDDSSEVFPTWVEYVRERLVAIDRRAAAVDAPNPGLRRRAASVIESLAVSVAGECRPVVCHRDLHPDNLIVGPDGSLAGIVDWDMAEAWDAAGEWFKLELFLFERLPSVREPFEVSYAAGAPAVGLERRRLVLLMESLNVVANAGVHAPEFIDFGLRQLDELT